MKKKITLASALLSAAVLAHAQEFTLSSPDGQTVLNMQPTSSGEYCYSINQNGKTLVEPSPLGFRLSDFDTKAANWQISSVDTAWIDREYDQEKIKQSHVHYVARQATYHVKSGELQFDVIFNVSNNNVAFRYFIPQSHPTGSVRVMEEYTGFHFAEQTTTFLTPQSDAMIGWKRTKPSYEEPYFADAPLDGRSMYGHGYTFPCLFRVGDDGWVLVSETGVDSRYCASHLSEAKDGVLSIAFPMPEENNGNGTPEPAFAVPGFTPWRTVTLGATLSPIVETTIAWDVVEPLFEPSMKYEYGKGTWSWILWQDNSINYDDQVRYIDLAEAMGFQFVLIDNFWDTNIGREGMQKLSEYARSKGVGLFVWYSSSGYWNDIVQGPTDRMDRSFVRKKEMQWLKSIGAKGIKVDFFGGDKQETMRLYEDILVDANEYGLMVIFHGCTLPRGWERMYPNYVGSEAVLASENLIFGQDHCDRHPFMSSMHPFVRNALGCMEFGGTFLNHRMNRTNDGGNTRRTTDVFELATAVLFQNPIQNFALAPNNLTDAPQICLDFLRNVPTTWDETHLIDGYPGQFVALERKSNGQSYYAVVNAKNEAVTVTLPIASGTAVDVYADAKDGEPTLSQLTTGSNKQKPATTNVRNTSKGLTLTVQPNGGAVVVAK